MSKNKKPSKKDKKLEIYRFTNKFYKFLREHSDHIFFEKIYGNTIGLYNYETENITVDYRRELLPTLIHEFIHHIHPDWSETRVLRLESRTINSLSKRQVKNILRVLGKVI